MCGNFHAVAWRDACKDCAFPRNENAGESSFRVGYGIVVHGLGEHLYGASEVKDLGMWVNENGYLIDFLVWLGTCHGGESLGFGKVY